MKSVQLCELGSLAADVKNGEMIEVRDGENLVAKIISCHEQTIEKRIDELVRQGKAKKGTGTLPADFLTRPRPRAKKSVLEQLLEDRRTGR